MNIFNLVDNCINSFIENGKLSKKQEATIKKIGYELAYVQVLTESVANMLEYDNVPNGLNTRFLEMYKIRNGTAGVMKKTDGNFTTFIGSFAGELDDYGLGKNYIGATLNGEPKEFTIGKDGVVCWNNKTGYADYPIILQYAHKLAELSTSVDMNVIFSRYAPLLGVTDNKMKQAIEQALNDIIIGKVGTFVMNMTLEEIAENKAKLELLNVTDVKNADKLQYLYKAIDDTLREFYNIYGISLNTTSKMAQQSASEINQTQGLSMIYPISRLRMADEFCEELNKLFDLNIKVHFSEVWQIEYDKYINSINRVCNNPIEEVKEVEEVEDDTKEGDDVED